MLAVRETVRVLCDLLNLMIETKVKPDHFRLAKFDKSDKGVVRILKTTLGCLIRDHEAFLEEVPDLGDYESCSSSRKLLMAIAHILAKHLGELIDELLEKSPFNSNYSILLSNDNEIISVGCPELHSKEDYCNYLVWVKGRTGQIKRISKSYQEQNAKMLQKLYKFVGPLEDLTPFQVLALTNKMYCLEFVKISDRILNILNTYLLWRRNESVFWKWMITVVNEYKTYKK